MKKIVLLRSLSVLALLALSACRSATPEQVNGLTMMPRAGTPEYYAYLGKAQDGTQSTTYLLQAAEGYLAEEDTARARQLLADIDEDTLTPPLQTHKTLVEAQLALEDGRSQRALEKLRDIAPATLSPELRQRYFDLSARSHELLGHYGEATYARSRLGILLTDSEARSNNDLQLWQDLQSLPDEQLKTMAQNADEKILKGWLDLTFIVKFTDEHSLMLRRLRFWQMQNIHHPANALLPQDIPRVAFTPKAQHIVALLPLHGHLGASGTAIRNGMLAQYYGNHLQDKTTLEFIDTSDGDIRQHYDKAVTDHADFIIGPLSKQNVEKLARHGKLPVPTLALNRVPLTHGVKNFYQLGLSSGEEASMVAHHAFEAGHRHALIITPDTRWGQNMAKTLAATWQANGGEVLGQLALNSKDSLSVQVSKSLHVNDSQWRAREVRRIIGQKVQFTPRRRQDIDVFLLALSPEEAKRLKPLLAFYYADDVPAYATSRIYAGSEQQKDLAGIIFCDMPWMLPGHSSFGKIKKQLQQTWPKEFSDNERLYALGIDSVNLSQDFNHLLLFPHFGVSGASGNLTLAPNGTIERELEWAVIKKNGLAKLA